MEEKIIKSGEITENFFYWMEATFGFDVGQFILVENWSGKHIPCKFDYKTHGIRDGYYGSNDFKVDTCYKWEIIENDNFTFLRLWYKYGDDAKFATTQTYLIEKCIRLPRISHLNMGVYEL